MKIQLYLPDLFFKVKVEEMLKHAEVNYAEISSLKKFNGDLLIANLEDEGVIDLVQTFPSQVICFCSHVNINLMFKAKSAGCEHVYQRSVFFIKLPQIIKEKIKN